MEAARQHGVWIVAGGMPEASGDAARPWNTSLLVSPDGAVVARYRKIHLFDVDLPDGTKLLESGATLAGSEPVIADVATAGAKAKLGMTNLLRRALPGALSEARERGRSHRHGARRLHLTTGKDHWHVLLRARAIENQVFVLAPAQHGRHPRGRTTYGKSLIVNPWGDVLAQCGEGEGIALAQLDFAAQDRVRASLPCLSHRRL